MLYKNIKSYYINRTLKKAALKFAYVLLKNGWTHFKDVSIVNIKIFSMFNRFLMLM